MATRVAEVPKPPADDIYYPESDGKPMAESDMHIEQIIALREALQGYFRGQPDVYVSGNIFVYYEEGDPSGVVSPDLLVVRGVEKKLRPIFRVWEEGKGPDLVLEVTSKSTRAEDTFAKFHVYQEVLRVPEYFLFDPTGDYLDPPLRGHRLMGDSYRPLEVTAGRVRSEVLGLDLIVEERVLRLHDPETDARLRTYAEAEAALREQAEALAKTEDELRRLRAELEALRGK